MSGAGNTPSCSLASLFPLFCGSQVLPPCRCSDLAAVAGVSAIITFVIVPSLARAFAGCTFPKQLADSPGQVHVRGSQTFGLLASSGQFCSKYGLVDKQTIYPVVGILPY